MQIAKGVHAAVVALTAAADELSDDDLEMVVGGLARALVDAPALVPVIEPAAAPGPLGAFPPADVHLEPSPA